MRRGKNKNKMSICTLSEDTEFSEVTSWPTGLAVGYMSIAFVTDNALFTIVFAYMWLSVEYVLMQFAFSLRDDTGTGGRWMANNVVSYIVSPSLVPGRACVSHPSSALVALPAMFVAAALLWEIGLKRCAGFKYDNAASGSMMQHRALAWAVFFMGGLLASRNILAAPELRSHTQQIKFDVSLSDPDLGMLLSAMLSALFTSIVPLRILLQNGADAPETRRALAAYGAYFTMLVVIAFTGILGGPPFNVASSYVRTMMALLVCHVGCAMAGAWRYSQRLAGAWRKMRRRYHCC